MVKLVFAFVFINFAGLFMLAICWQIQKYIDRASISKTTKASQQSKLDASEEAAMDGTLIEPLIRHRTSFGLLRSARLLSGAIPKPLRWNERLLIPKSSDKPSKFGLVPGTRRF
jgi:hypothetical protein